MRRIMLGIALALAFVGGVAQAAPPAAKVDVSARATLTDGSARITMKIRCSDRLQGFEWSVGVRQGATFGSASAGPTAGLIICDGRFHAVTAIVTGVEAFAPGPAEVTALVQFFDSELGSDIEAGDTTVVRLR